MDHSSRTVARSGVSTKPGQFQKTYRELVLLLSVAAADSDHSFEWFRSYAARQCDPKFAELTEDQWRVAVGKVRAEPDNAKGHAVNLAQAIGAWASVSDKRRQIQRAFKPKNS